MIWLGGTHRTADGSRVEVPFVSAIVPAVDLEARVITPHPTVCSELLVRRSESGEWLGGLSAGGVGVSEFGGPLVVAVGEGLVGPSGLVSDAVVVAA